MNVVEKNEPIEENLKFSNNKEQISVKLGEIIFTNDPEYYSLLGIGTCLGIYIFDLKKGMYMMAHTVLPHYSEIKKEFETKMPARFTDLAISLMVKRFLNNGSKKSDLTAKIVGGSQIFNDKLVIGKRNIESAIETLKENDISLVAQDVGGSQGRSIYSYNKDGSMTIRQNGKYYTI